MQMNDKAQRFVCMLLCGWIALCLYSCHDGQLAEELEGTWHTSYTMKDENGIPYTEEQKVKFILSEEDFALVDRNLKRVVEPGTFQVMIGAASDDIRLQTKVEIK